MALVRLPSTEGEPHTAVFAGTTRLGSVRPGFPAPDGHHGYVAVCSRFDWRTEWATQKQAVAALRAHHASEHNQNGENR